MISLKGKSFLKLLDFTPAQISGLLELSADLKRRKKMGIPHTLCSGKSIALVFEKGTGAILKVGGVDKRRGGSYDKNASG